MHLNEKYNLSMGINIEKRCITDPVQPSSDSSLNRLFANEEDVKVSEIEKHL